MSDVASRCGIHVLCVLDADDLRAVSLYRVPAAVLRAPVEGDEVMLHGDTGVYYLVKGSARRLLADLEAGSTVEEAAARLSERTGEDRERVLADTRSFVATMVECGLLEEVAQ